MSPLRLGRLSLRSSSLLAPLEGVSDVGFRAVCARLGAGLTFTEMVRADALGRRNAASLALIDSHDARTPTGVQLLASSAPQLLQALRVLEEAAMGPAPHLQNLVAVDLNFGCPSETVVRDGAGPALLKRRSRLREIFKALVSFRDANCLGIVAVGAKLRLGLNRREAAGAHPVFIDAAAIAADEGLDWVTLHARHAGQRSSELPSWGAFAAARRALEGAGTGDARPRLIANGNVRTETDRDALIASGAVDGVMLARAPMRNPWIFTDLLRGDDGASRDGVAGTACGPSVEWDDGGTWPTAQEVDEAASEWRTWAAVGAGSRPKHHAYHEAAWARLRGPARGGVELPMNAHMT